MNELIMRRRRAKTPVFAVGQLESSQLTHCDATQILADRYRALLPPRLMTPFVGPDLEEESEAHKLPNKTIRKIKRQQSLRNLMKLHSRASSISDSETLVGSPSPSSPLTPSHPYFDLKGDKHEFDHLKDLDDEYQTLKKRNDSSSTLNNDMTLKICMDLLSKELSATRPNQHHLANDDERASGLQLLLMIEAYETVQKHRRTKSYSSQEEDRDDHVQDVEKILEYWLQALDSVYSRSHEQSKAGNEEFYPPPLSFGSGNRMRVKHPHICEMKMSSREDVRMGWNENGENRNFF